MVFRGVQIYVLPATGKQDDIRLPEMVAPFFEQHDSTPFYTFYNSGRRTDILILMSCGSFLSATSRWPAAHATRETADESRWS